MNLLCAAAGAVPKGAEGDGRDVVIVVPEYRRSAIGAQLDL